MPAPADYRIRINANCLAQFARRRTAKPAYLRDREPQAATTEVRRFREHGRQVPYRASDDVLPIEFRHVVTLPRVSSFGSRQFFS